ncbi:hypothetical protein Mic7113_4427 [Allocoleopsis franciscana PCC 7113]|uniref:Uncharacterized protein n=1 Tax=Allocoleopsis franciscana PCC 7113 TaxID=1173027 RepID=K9WIA4_9CYAN|nr:hypothetical protein Mic7113_4427 [Allocoleopsis franciscana PCC 7113]
MIIAHEYGGQLGGLLMIFPVGAGEPSNNLSLATLEILFIFLLRHYEFLFHSIDYFF